MTIELPKTIADYFAAESACDVNAIARCYTEDAVVTDNGEKFSGREAIKQFMADVFEKYNATTTPLSIAEDGDRHLVTCRVEGNFPGSPIDLRYFFHLAGAKIDNLEMTV